MWVRRDPKILSLVFEALEDLTTLREDCEGRIQAARTYEYLHRKIHTEPDESGLQRWLRVYRGATVGWQVVDHLVRTTQLDTGRCYEAYKDLLGLQPIWWKLAHSSEARALVERVTTCLKQVLIHHRPSRGPRRRGR